MRISSCVLGVVCLAGVSIDRAEADVSKAWDAAKDNLPGHTQFVLAVDVVALQKSAAFPKVLEAFKAEERGFAKIYDAIKGACGIDPLSMVDGIVIAGDTRTEEGVAFIQMTVDRTKASACFQSALASIDKGSKISVKQDGIYTVASKGTGNRDTAYFPWIGPSVVMVSLKPERKDKVDAWFKQKGFWQSKISGKIDPKVAISGAFAGDKPFDSMLPVIAAHGTLALAGGKLTGSIVATATDAGAATKIATEMNKELQRDLKRDRTPPSVKKIMSALTVAATGSDVTLKGSVAEKDVGAAFAELGTKKKKEEARSGSSAALAAIAKMDEFAKKMCACKDKACADKVNEELTKWGTEMAKDPRYRDEKPDPDIAKRAADIMTRYTECMTKLMMAGAGRP